MIATIPRVDRDEAYQKFVEVLEGLSAGERAKLKRGAGKRLGDAELRTDTVVQFYRIAPPGLSRARVDAYFLVATLYPLAQRNTSNSQRNLGHALRACRTSKNAAGLDRRVEALLDADEQQLPYRLRRAVQYIAAQDGAVPWARLLADIQRWGNAQTRPHVRREWAEAYFAAAVQATDGGSGALHGPDAAGGEAPKVETDHDSPDE